MTCDISQCNGTISLSYYDNIHKCLYFDMFLFITQATIASFCTLAFRKIYKILNDYI